MPVALLRSYVRMLPRLEAEEQLRAIEAASTPWMKAPDQRKAIDALREQAAQQRRRRAGPHELARLFSGVGIPVERS